MLFGNLFLVSLICFTCFFLGGDSQPFCLSLHLHLLALSFAATSLPIDQSKGDRSEMFWWINWSIDWTHCPSFRPLQLLWTEWMTSGWPWAITQYQHFFFFYLLPIKDELTPQFFWHANLLMKCEVSSSSCSKFNSGAFRVVICGHFSSVTISFFFFFSKYILHFRNIFLPWGGAHWNCKSALVCLPAGCQERWHHRWLQLCGILMGMIWKIGMAVFPFEKILRIPPLPFSLQRWPLM